MLDNIHDHHVQQNRSFSDFWTPLYDQQDTLTRRISNGFYSGGFSPTYCSCSSASALCNAVEFLGASEKDKCFQMKDKDVVCLVCISRLTHNVLSGTLMQKVGAQGCYSGCRCIPSILRFHLGDDEWTVDQNTHSAL